MALPPKLSQTFLPSELFFLAEDATVTILPRQSLDSIQLIGLKTPRLRPLHPAEVPLWFACILKKQSRCSMVVPEWLRPTTLRSIYEEELHDPSEFCGRLPRAWLEISQVFLDVARDDFDTPPTAVRGLVRDLREARQAKARAGIKELNESHMRMDNLGTLELNELRPFIAGVMDELQRLVASIEEGEEGEQAEQDYDDDMNDY